ncbi:MAG: RNA methyltransferase [Solirubrobacterales bacterium]|nr:RNA methyltransferase [Solirubrobacterales bacterium]
MEMITSSDNKRLKMVAKLRRRKTREKEGLFLTEGEDLLEAGLAAGWRPEVSLVAAGSGLDGEETDPVLLDAASALGSGTRAIAIWPVRWSEVDGGTCIFLAGLSDPGNTGSIIRTTDALLEATVVIGPNGADPFSPAAVRASMGAIFSQAVARGDVGTTPTPRIGLVAEGGSEPVAPSGPVTLCLGSEREGLEPEVLNQCDERWTIPMRGGAAGSLNVAAAAAIACDRLRAVSNPAEMAGGGIG